MTTMGYRLQRVSCAELSPEYRYLGAPVKILSAQPPGRQTHPIVRDLLDRLQRRLSVSPLLRNLNLDVLTADVPPSPPLCMQPTPEVPFTPTSKTDPPYSTIATRLTTRGHSDVCLANATAEHLTKEACDLPPREDGCPLFLSCYFSRVRSSALLPVRCRRDAVRPLSVTIHHYDSVCLQKCTYRRRSLMLRRHNVVSARLRLGYRLPGQISEVEGEPPYTECRLCHAPNCNTIEHYCLQCPAVHDVVTRGQTLVAMCQHLLQHHILEELLAQFPRFMGFSYSLTIL
ncbi:hypothetical protein E2C01_047229 [Portunus trituberculatus]|uniref:Uncharacterized protein n=1 Tax=Portunus trituberculatus TaxID=210409 RepID=A0A5B7G6W6_PORTR|nr:hypothetical protein [Portunus trituberculatus]